MKERIVFVLPQLKTGGGVRVIVELANVLARKYDVAIVLPNGTDDCTFYIDPAVRIEKTGAVPSGIVGRVTGLLKPFFYLKKKYADDVIIVTDPIQSILFALFRFKKGYRFVQADDYRIFDDLLLLKNRFFLALYKTATKLSYRRNIGYIFNSDFTWRQFVDLKGKSVPKRIVHPSVNHAVFNADKRDMHNNSDNQKYNIALIARKHPMKRFGDFIVVYRQIKTMPEVMVHIGKITIISHDDLSAYDLKDFERVVPRSDREISEVFNASDIYIFTSEWEGFGLPPLEAMSCGCAVIASDAKGIREYAVDGENALLYAPGDTGGLKYNLIRLLSDPVLLEKLQQNGLKRAGEFSWEKSAKMLEEIIFAKRETNV